MKRKSVKEVSAMNIHHMTSLTKNKQLCKYLHKYNV